MFSSVYPSFLSPYLVQTCLSSQWARGGVNYGWSVYHRNKTNQTIIHTQSHTTEQFRVFQFSWLINTNKSRTCSKFLKNCLRGSELLTFILWCNVNHYYLLLFKVVLFIDIYYLKVKTLNINIFNSTEIKRLILALIIHNKIAFGVDFLLCNLNSIQTGCWQQKSSSKSFKVMGHY